MTTVAPLKKLAAPALRAGRHGLVLVLVLLALPTRADVDTERLIFEARLPAQPAPLVAPGANATNAPALGPLPLLDALDLHRNRVTEVETRQGPFGPGLVQEYLELGLGYQALGRHDDAIEAFADAEHISRINAGLVNPALFGIIEASIPSHLARGEWQEVGRRQQVLYRLTRDFHGVGSTELVPVLTRLAEWQLATFRQGLRRQPVVSIGGSTGDPRRQAFFNLYRAQQHYAEAIATLLQSPQLQANELIRLEQLFVQSVFLGANREGLLDDPAFFMGYRRGSTGSRILRKGPPPLGTGYFNGRSAYERMQIYAQVQGLPVLEQARLLLEEADWHLLFDHHGLARSVYAEALQLLRDDGVQAEQAAALLAPALPRQLPGFMPLPHSRGYYGLDAQQTVDWKGWVDVSFELSRYGALRDLRVVDASEGTDPDVATRLRRLLHSAPFRPHLSLQGEAEATKSPVYEVRYYYAFAPDDAEALAMAVP